MIDVAGQLTLGGTVSADGLGFRGGAGRQLSSGAGAQTDYVTLSTNGANGSKGEGIAGTPKYLANSAITALITNADGRPAQRQLRAWRGRQRWRRWHRCQSVANDKNSGGGGGGNGSGGGNGGYAWNTASLGNGFGGSPFPGSVSNIIMGGGRRRWHHQQRHCRSCERQSRRHQQQRRGRRRHHHHSRRLSGWHRHITANGQNALDVQNDGAGGGGAGGSIELLTLSADSPARPSPPTVATVANTWLTQAPGSPYPGCRHGPGGGGGGGVILTSSAPASAMRAAGNNGTSTTIHDSYGATPGLGNGIDVLRISVRRALRRLPAIVPVRSVPSPTWW